MIRGLRGMILGLCITAMGISGAGAQQKPPNNNSNIAQIQQLGQEIQGLRKQLEPLYSQIQRLMAQVNASRERIQHIKEKMNADRERVRALFKKNG